MKLLKVSALVVVALLLGTSEAVRQQGGAVAKKLAQYNEKTNSLAQAEESSVTAPTCTCTDPSGGTFEGAYVKAHKNGL
jgi:hypothetical protein